MIEDKLEATSSSRSNVVFGEHDNGGHSMNLADSNGQSMQMQANLWTMKIDMPRFNGENPQG